MMIMISDKNLTTSNNNYVNSNNSNKCSKDKWLFGVSIVIRIQYNILHKYMFLFLCHYNFWSNIMTRQFLYSFFRFIYSYSVCGLDRTLQCIKMINIDNQVMCAAFFNNKTHKPISTVRVELNDSMNQESFAPIGK